MEEKAISKIVEDHLKQLVIQYFDPKKADMIFENGAVSIFMILESYLLSGCSNLVRMDDTRCRMETGYL